MRSRDRSHRLGPRLGRRTLAVRYHRLPRHLRPPSRRHVWLADVTYRRITAAGPDPAAPTAR